MKRERSRSRAVLTAVRPERMRGDVIPLAARAGARREAPACRDGLAGFLAVLPRLFASLAEGRDAREVANGRARSTFGDDAA